MPNPATLNAIDSRSGPRHAWRLWIVVLALTTGTSWCYRRTPGTSDVDIWLGWLGNVMAAGPIRGYVNSHSDYPPGASAVLWIVGRIAASTHSDPRATLKIVLFTFLLVTTGLLMAWSRRVTIVLLAQLTLVTNAVGLMYLDILTAPFLVGAVRAASQGRGPLMLGLIGSACVMKWQPLFLLPFAGVYVALQRRAVSGAIWRRTLISGAAILSAIAIAAIAVYGLPSLIDSLYRASRHNNLSNFGANPWWVLTWLLETTKPSTFHALSPDGSVAIAPASRPMLRALSLLTLIFYVATLRKYWRSGDRSLGAFLRFALVGYLVYFMCSAGVHENHLFLGSLLALLLAWQDPTRTWLAVVLGIAATANPLVFYGWTGRGADRMALGFDATVWVAAATSVTLGVIAWRLVRRNGGVEIRKNALHSDAPGV